MSQVAANQLASQFYDQTYINVECTILYIENSFTVWFTTSNNLAIIQDCYYIDNSSSVNTIANLALLKSQVQGKHNTMHRLQTK